MRMWYPVQVVHEPLWRRSFFDYDLWIQKEILKIPIGANSWSVCSLPIWRIYRPKNIMFYENRFNSNTIQFFPPSNIFICFISHHFHLHMNRTAQYRYRSMSINVNVRQCRFVLKQRSHTTREYKRRKQFYAGCCSWYSILDDVNVSSSVGVRCLSQ